MIIGERSWDGELLYAKKKNAHKEIYNNHHIYFQSILKLTSWASKKTKMPNFIIFFPLQTMYIYEALETIPLLKYPLSSTFNKSLLIP